MQCAFCERNAQYRDPTTGEYVCLEHARLEVSSRRGASSRHAHAIRPAAGGDYAHVLRLAEYFWGETELESFGQTYNLADLPALLAWAPLPTELVENHAAEGEQPLSPVGLLSYALERDRAVIVVLNVLPDYQGLGIASQLIAQVCEIAREAGLPRIVVATSNDDLPALSLYQRHGFHLVNLRPGAILAHHGHEEAGFSGIPVRDEIHLARDLSSLSTAEPPMGEAATARPSVVGARTATAKRKVGLALGGGAARGIAHLGVLEVLEEAGIRPDAVAGVSAGSVAGALYCAGVPLQEMKAELRGLAWRKLGRVVQPRMGFFDIDRLADYLDERFLRGARFEDLPIPFAALAVDLLTGKEVVLNTGRVAWAVRTSCAVPGAFTPVIEGERVLVDGGLANNVPVSLARTLGADYVIAVDLFPPPSNFKVPRNIFEMWSMMFYRLGVAHGESQQADCLIQPALGRMSVVDFSLANTFIARGREAALQQLDRLRQDLGL